jgi:phospholipid/cholesterol/gamma-HCH transport system ATP-binding protein
MAFNEPIVEVEGLSKRFDDLLVLDDVSLSFPNKQITAILGKSGTGKSVLMKNIIGILEPDAGKIKIEGVDIVPLPEKQRRKFRQRLGYLFQDSALFDSMTVEENIAFPLVEVFHMRNHREIRRIVQEKLEWVQLPGIENKYPDELSGGMRKRVALARSLAGEPEILLFDEPTTGLDPVLEESVNKLISRVNRELEMTCIIITHDIVGSFQLADKIAFLDEGKIQVEGIPEDVADMAHPVLQKFLEYSFTAAHRTMDEMELR